MKDNRHRYIFFYQRALPDIWFLVSTRVNYIRHKGILTNKHGFSEYTVSEKNFFKKGLIRLAIKLKHTFSLKYADFAGLEHC